MEAGLATNLCYGHLKKQQQFLPPPWHHFYKLPHCSLINNPLSFCSIQGCTYQSCIGPFFLHGVYLNLMSSLPAARLQRYKYRCAKFCRWLVVGMARVRLTIQSSCFSALNWSLLMQLFYREKGHLHFLPCASFSQAFWNAAMKQCLLTFPPNKKSLIIQIMGVFSTLSLFPFQNL